MSSTSRRVAAVAVAAIVAVLTGAAVGLVSPQRTCAATGTGGVTCTVDMFAPVPAVVAFVGAVGAAAAAAFALAVLPGGRRDRTGDRSGRRSGTAAAVAAAAVPGATVNAATVNAATVNAATVNGADHTSAADRAALVDACIYVRDRLTSRALADRLGAALDSAGVHTDAPAGARFDPTRHEAGGAAPCTDPSRVGTIAAVEVPGYTDRDGRALRVPVVTVYRTATEPGDHG